MRQLLAAHLFILDSFIHHSSSVVYSKLDSSNLSSVHPPSHPSPSSIMPISCRQTILTTTHTHPSTYPAHLATSSSTAPIGICAPCRIGTASTGREREGKRPGSRVCRAVPRVCGRERWEDDGMRGGMGDCIIFKEGVVWSEGGWGGSGEVGVGGLPGGVGSLVIDGLGEEGT
jgi:hypothetical protein